MKPFYDADRYLVRITNQALGSTSKGNIQLVVSFLVLGKPDPANPENYFPAKQQLERRFYRVINENTIEFVLEDLRALGFSGDSFAQLDPSSPNHFSFKDLELEMYCGHGRDDKGEVREEWSIARGGGPLVKEAAPGEKVRQLDYAFGARLRSLREKTAPMASAPRPPKQQPVAAGNLEITDDDVPF